MKHRNGSSKSLLRGAISVLLVLAMMGAAAVGCFAETTTASEEATGITGVNISVGEDITVKFHTTAETNDGSRLEISYNGVTYTLKENVEGEFSFVYVTPQRFNDEMTVTMYDSAEGGNQVGDTKTVSVKSYLTDMLAYDRVDGVCKCKCTSDLKHEATQELCVDLLNYGAAAQTYVSHDTENLANKDLTDAQKALATDKITVTDTDKDVNGDAWVGAGVRFDYKLGLYFVFEATSADEYTAYINDTEVTPEEYTVLGEGKYVIRYNSFNATNMNDVVTAKLTKDGADDQTFSYSIKSYVASKGGDTSNIANLVNATYVYGFAAVAYSAEYITVDPTFEEAGSISMDGKGYDFSQSKYGTITLPKLDFENYTVETVNSGSATAPKVTTSFKWIDTRVDYTCNLKSNDYINIDNVIYSQYDFTQQTNEKLTIEYNAQSGYTVTGTDASVSNLTTGGADLTIKGTVNTTGALTSTSPSLIIDGALNVNGTLTAKNTFEENNDYEYGFRPAIYVRGGTLVANNIRAYLLQVGSEKYNQKGTLTLSADTQLIYNGTKNNGNAIRYIFAKGEFNATFSGSSTTVIDCRTRNANGGHVYFGDGMNIVISKAKDTAAILRLVGGFNTPPDGGKCSYDLYMSKNATLNYGGTFGQEFAAFSNASGGVDQYCTTTANVTINEESKLVRLVEAKTGLVNNPESPNSSNEVNFHYDNLMSDCPDVSNGAVVTLGTEKISCGIMGEFTKVTHIDGVELDTSIYCQILDWEVAQ